MHPSKAIEYLVWFMAREGHKPADLSRLLGSRSRAAEVLLGRRKLSTAMIRKLSETWRADANELVKQ